MLEIKGLKKSYGDKEVLHGLNLSLAQGEITGIIGKNGAGKTTLFHSILNFFSYEGEILLNGSPIDASVYSKLGYLPEERSLMQKLTVKDQIRYLAELKDMSRAEIDERLPEWMERLEVKGKLTDKIKTLSKGNQQKLQLIATLIHEPDFIILDEPFSGLDPVNADLLKRVIKEEKARGAVIVFSDHVMTNVEELCDNLVMIKDGDLVLNGSVNDVRNSFGKTRLFVSTDLSQSELEALPKVLSADQTNQGTWCLILEDESAGPDLFQLLTNGNYITTFDQQAPTIDEIFKMKAR